MTQIFFCRHISRVFCSSPKASFAIRAEIRAGFSPILLSLPSTLSQRIAEAQGHSLHKSGGLHASLSVLMLPLLLSLLSLLPSLGVNQGHSHSLSHSLSLFLQIRHFRHLSLWRSERRKIRKERKHTHNRVVICHNNNIVVVLLAFVAARAFAESCFMFSFIPLNESALISLQSARSCGRGGPPPMDGTAKKWPFGYD